MEHFTSFDGTEIAYLDEGSGPPVVLHHGFAADHHGNWVAPGVVAALVAEGRRVVALDARGHGQSGKPHDPDAYADHAMENDLAGLFDHLGLADVDLVGYSMGAIVSAHFTPTDDRVRSLILGGIGGAVTRGRPRSRSEGLADALTAEDPASVTDPTGRAFRAFADSTGADRHALAAIARSGTHDDPPPLGAISVPTLVLVGSGDTLVGDPRQLAEAVKGAQCTVIGGDHLGAVVDPGFTPAILDFVRR